MTGRLTANVLLFAATAITVANAGSYGRTNHVTFGRGVSFRSDSPMRSATNLLDTSQWLTTGATTPIRIDDVVLPDMEDDSTKESTTGVTLVAAVRTRRRPSLRIQQEAEETTKEETTMRTDEQIDPTILNAISQPFVPKSIWSRLQGSEFDQPAVIEAFVKSGLSMTHPDDNEWIKWKAHKNKGDEAAAASDDDLDVRVHVGRCSRADSDLYYGANLPMLKTEAIIRMKPKDMAELLLDSTRVQVYNKMSIGRKDIRHIVCEHGIAKIVKNLTQPPITKKKIESTTFMHARKLNEEGTYLVVSRAVTLPGNNDDNDEDSDHGKSEILLGVNLLEPCGEDQMSSKMTSVTHVYASALPAVLATRVGVSSALNFVKDIRSICEEPE
jgi:hypothetical protein